MHQSELTQHVDQFFNLPFWMDRDKVPRDIMRVAANDVVYNMAFGICLECRRDSLKHSRMIAEDKAYPCLEQL